jgi:predicted permease
MPTLSYDFRSALRQLRGARGMALLAIVTLALGVGANAAIFTVIESVLLRPLPYAHGPRLVYIGGPAEKPSFNGSSATSWLNYSDLKSQTRALETVAGYSEDAAVLQTRDSTQSVAAPHVTPNLLPMLGAKPLLGRTFSEAEGEAGGPPAAILSEGLWRETFHADPNIVGRSVQISGKAHSVVGVMPRDFRFPDAMGPDMRKGIWVPLQPTKEMLKDRGYSFVNVVGVLRPGIPVGQAQHEIDSITAHIPRKSDESAIHLQAWLYQEVLTGPVRPVLYGLLAALGLVLLIACANVSNILLARCLGRRQEFAVRAALGAGKGRLIGQMLAEGMILSVAGCALGVILAELAILALRKLPEGTIPRSDSISLHWTIVLVMAAVAIVTTVLSALLPAVMASRANPQTALQAGSRGVGSHSVGGKLSGILVAGEVALSTVLLVGTGLLFHTLWNLEQARLGFETAHLTTFTAMPADAAGFSAMAVSEDTAHAPASVATLTYLPLLEKIRHLPGIDSAALATSLPLSGMNVGSSFDILGRPTAPDKKPIAGVTAVSGDYARAMGTPVVRGRMITDADTAATPLVVAVNQEFVKKYLSDTEPLGKQINLGGKDTGMIQPFTIVGVIGDQVDSHVGGEAQPMIYLPEAQVPTTSLFYQALLKTVVSFVVKTRANIPVTQDMRNIFHQAAPGFALDNFQTMQEAVEQTTFSHRLALYLVASFAGLAVLMVVAGLYGVLTQLVSYRRREIGIRMALGATRRGVAGLVVRQGSLLIGYGIAAGLVLAFASGRLIQSYLYEVHPLDGLTYLAVVAVLALVGGLAAALPAQRAASVQPMESLREQ